MKVYQAIANEINRINMNQYGAEFALEDLIKKFLPSGSGFDADITIDYDPMESECKKYTLTVPYHKMNPDGYYNGWIEVDYIITPSFIDYNIRENWHGYKNRDKEILRNYILDTIVFCLDKEIKHSWNMKEQRNYYVEA
jgi:hypothetical protein